MTDFIEEYFPQIVLVILISITIPLVVLSFKQGKERENWRISHCEVIGKESDSVGIANTVSANGHVGFGTVFIASKTGYKCDDGLIYWE